ncbi:hypothetical protein L3V82_06060 [Thiotrichales bacterium 19S3-7]|nr:hypothetical protein [Thiotrichales bacterium 19S3-7]MCF6801659.1 hypothetical protein [Thiotrichales bacterium 19S3-11]
MKCPFTGDANCHKNYLILFVCFTVAVIVLSLIIKLGAWILSLFSNDLYLNTVVVMFSSVVVLIAAVKCCCKKNKAIDDTQCCEINKSHSD